MRLIKRLIPALLLAAAAAGCAGGAKSPCAGDAEANEYAVFSAAVNEFGGGREGRRVVIFDHTEYAPESGEARSPLARCEGIFDGTEKPLADSYRERNRRPLELARRLTLGKEYALASAEDLKSIPAERMRLVGARDKYPDAFGVVSLSRAGFDPAMTKAVVYVAQGWCGLGCGEGVCMLLVRDGC